MPSRFACSYCHQDGHNIRTCPTSPTRSRPDGKGYSPEWYAKNKERLKPLRKKWREEHPQETKSYSLKKYERRKEEATAQGLSPSTDIDRAWAKQYKELNPCLDCGCKYDAEDMFFHHRDPRTKSGTVSTMLRNESRLMVLEEILKCDLLCEVCHRIRHMTEKYGVIGWRAR